MVPVKENKIAFWENLIPNRRRKSITKKFFFDFKSKLFIEKKSITDVNGNVNVKQMEQI